MWISIIIGSAVGVGLGFILPTVPYVASKYLAIAIIAALDTVLGGIANNVDNKFDSKVFISGFFVELHPNAYRDIFINDTIAYIIVYVSIAIYKNRAKRKIKN